MHILEFGFGPESVTHMMFHIQAIRNWLPAILTYTINPISTLYHFPIYSHIPHISPYFLWSYCPPLVALYSDSWLFEGEISKMNNLGSNLIISLVNGQLWRIRVLKCVFWSDYFSLSKGRNNTVFSYFFTRFYPILAGFLGSRDGGESYDGTTVWYVKLKTVFRQRKANEAIGDSMKNMSVRNGFEINFENPILYRPYRPHNMKYPLQHDQN